MTVFKKEIEQAILSMDRIKVETKVSEYLKSNTVISLFDETFSPILEKIGEDWQKGEASLAQVYMAGRICEDLANRLFPEKKTKKDSDPAAGTAPVPAIALLNDYHSLGKNVVLSILRIAGYSVTDYGRTTVGELKALLEKDPPLILLISVLMLPSALDVRHITAHVAKNNLPVKVIVGGAPFRYDTNLWKETGADAMGMSAADALTLVRQFSEGENS